MRNFIICTHPQISLGKSNQGEWGRRDMWHAWERNVYRILMGRPEVKRPLGRQTRRREDGIRMDLREIGWGSVDWMQLAQDRDRWRAVVSAVMNLRVLALRSYLATVCLPQGTRLFTTNNLLILSCSTPLSGSVYQCVVFDWGSIRVCITSVPVLKHSPWKDTV
jgi:hypothetical protein